MYRLFTKILFLSFLCTATFTACKKDKDESVALTKENLVGTYKLTASTVNGADVMAQMNACEKDDLFKFNTDGTYENVDAGAQCSTADSGTWTLPGNNTISLDGEAMTVEKFDGKTLTYYYTVQNITYKETYTKQ